MPAMTQMPPMAAQAAPASTMTRTRPVPQMPQSTAQTRTVSPAAGFRTQEFPPEPITQQRPRVKRSDFILLDDIVIVHTDERIN